MLDFEVQLRIEVDVLVVEVAGFVVEQHQLVVFAISLVINLGRVVLFFKQVKGIVTLREQIVLGLPLFYNAVVGNVLSELELFALLGYDAIGPSVLQEVLAQ